MGENLSICLFRKNGDEASKGSSPVICYMNGQIRGLSPTQQKEDCTLMDIVHVNLAHRDKNFKCLHAVWLTVNF